MVKTENFLNIDNFAPFGWFFMLPQVISSNTYSDTYLKNWMEKTCRSLELFFCVAVSSAILCIRNSSHLGFPYPCCLLSSGRLADASYVPSAYIVAWKFCPTESWGNCWAPSIVLYLLGTILLSSLMFNVWKLQFQLFAWIFNFFQLDC